MKRSVLVLCMLAMIGMDALSASEPADARLDQKVTIESIGTPLGDFLRDVSAQTGVRFSARKDASDIKIAVFIKDVPLSSLRDALKDCLHLQCTREGKKDEWTYSFWEDLKTKQAAEQLKQEEIKKLRAFIEKLIKQADDIEAEGKEPVEFAKEIGALSLEKKEQFIHGSPERYAAAMAFAADGTLPAITAYSALSQAQVRALWAGEKVTIRSADMSPELGQRFDKRLEPWIRHMLSLGSWGGQDVAPADPGETGQVVFSIGESEWNNKPSLKYMFGNGGSSLTVPLEEKTNPPQEDVGSEADSRPDLRLKDAYTSTCYQVMEQAHDLTDVGIVSDYYTRLDQKSIMPNITAGNFRPFKTGDDVLRQVAVDTECDLGAMGEIRLISRKTWPGDRDREIPERLLVKWRKARKDYGGARIEEALEMAGLSRLQLGDLDMYKTGYGESIIAGGHMALRMAASLSAGQWQAAMTEQGLPTAGMSNAQLALIQSWAKASEEYGSSTRLSDELSDPQRLRSCLFKVRYRGPGGKNDVQGRWEFELYPPSYYEAIRKGASEATSKDQGFAVPSPECRGYIRLADLNQGRGWPSPSDEKGEDTQASK